MSFPGTRCGALLLSRNSPEHSDLDVFIRLRNSAVNPWAGDYWKTRLKMNHFMSQVVWGRHLQKGVSP